MLLATIALFIADLVHETADMIAVVTTTLLDLQEVVATMADVRATGSIPVDTTTEEIGMQCNMEDMVSTSDM
jgi:hypothetical protein